MNRRLNFWSVAGATFVLSSGFFSFSVLAQESNRELPKQGSLSATFQGGDEGVAIPGPWGAEESDIFSEDKSPISGSVSRGMRGSEWVAKLFNNSQDRFSVDVEVVQYDDRERVVKRDSFSTTLSAGQSVERTFSARSNSHQGELNLRSWKNLSQQQRDREAARKAAEEQSAEQE